MTLPAPMKAWNKPWVSFDLRFPLIASRKINGERIRVMDGRVLASSGKPIRNRHIQQTLSHSLLEGLDGEITCGPPTSPMVRCNTRSGVGTRDSTPSFHFHIFDSWDRGREPFWDWRQEIFQFHPPLYHYIMDTPHLSFVPQIRVSSWKKLQDVEEAAVRAGWEGLILRSPSQPYKNGRCTLREFQAGQGMLKMKRFQDSEAVVLSVYARNINLNPQGRDPQGYAERSSAKAGKLPINQLGGLEVRDLSSGKVFRIGTGLGWTDREREFLYSIRLSLPGRFLTYRHFPEGHDGLPTQPIFHAWRDFSDFSTGDQ